MNTAIVNENKEKCSICGRKLKPGESGVIQPNNQIKGLPKRLQTRSFITICNECKKSVSIVRKIGKAKNRRRWKKLSRNKARKKAKLI